MGLFDMFSKAKGNAEEKEAQLKAKAPVGASGAEFSSQFRMVQPETLGQRRTSRMRVC